MSSRKNFYFRQRVSEAELDSAFDGLEAADHHLAGDLGFVGVLANAVVSPHAPVPNLTVDVSGPGTALDQLGRRIFFSGLQNVNVAQDDNGVATEVSAANRQKIVSVLLMFDRTLSDPRVDGNSQTVFFQRDEGFKFVVVQGAEAATGEAVPPALRGDALLLADVVRRFNQPQIGTDAISMARRQDAFVLAGAPRAIRRGQTTEAIADLLGFYNAHVGGAADRHPAAAIDYAGGNTAWADGGQNPATTVEAQIDKIISDLALEGGGAKIGTAATAGTPRALVAGSVKSQLDALLGFVNGHLTASTGAHGSATIVHAAGPNWKDGTTNPVTNVRAQLDKLVADLAADAGASRIGIGARANWIDGRTNPAGVSVAAAVQKIIVDLGEAAETDGAARVAARAAGNLAAGSVRSQLDALDATSVRTIVANVFSATQTINGAAGDTSPTLATTTAASTRKLLWEIVGAQVSYRYRLYAATAAFEITVNARWTGTQWAKDSPTLAATKLELTNTELRLNGRDAAATPFPDQWPSSIAIPLTGHGPQSLDAGGNWISAGPTEAYIGWQGGSAPSGLRVGAGATFRKVFPAVPSSITFTVLDELNLVSGPHVHHPTPVGTGAYIETRVGVFAFFYARVLAA